VQRLIFNNDLKDFINLIGQLRFQQRWAQTPRVPETTVAGHTLIVAILSYMITLEMDACDRRRYNAFFAGLFHDLPEVLTRDIISPVKSSVEGLGDLIKGIEEDQMEEVIYPMLPEKWGREIRYFTENEFDTRILDGGIMRRVGQDELSGRYNRDEWSPVDGQVIEFCDKFAAYMEAYLSIKHGITSRNLEEGHRDIYNRFSNFKAGGQNLGMLLDYFKL
jgi:putative hydrolase of HD superfamily